MKNKCRCVVQTKWWTSCCGCCCPLPHPPTWTSKPLQKLSWKILKSLVYNILAKNIVKKNKLHTLPTIMKFAIILKKTRPHTAAWLLMCGWTTNEFAYNYKNCEFWIKKERKKSNKIQAPDPWLICKHVD